MLTQDVHISIYIIKWKGRLKERAMVPVQSKPWKPLKCYLQNDTVSMDNTLVEISSGFEPLNGQIWVASRSYNHNTHQVSQSASHVFCTPTGINEPTTKDIIFVSAGLRANLPTNLFRCISPGIPSDNYALFILRLGIHLMIAGTRHKARSIHVS